MKFFSKDSLIDSPIYIMLSKITLKKLLSSSKYFIELQRKFGCNNYEPLPIVITKGQGTFLFDLQGKKYFDFMSAHSAINQGHCNPTIMKAITEQAQKLTLSSRFIYSDQLGILQQKLNNIFGYDRSLILNTGMQVGQNAIKLARRWANKTKNIPQHLTTILFAQGSFWGRSIGAYRASTNPQQYTKLGSLTGFDFDLIEYGNLNALENALISNPNIVAYMTQPLLVDRGLVIHIPGYLQKAHQLLRKHGALLISDQIQTGLGRTGKLLCSYYDQVRPDMVLLGKALSGGYYPVSAMLCDKIIFNLLESGQYKSTYGGNPLGANTAIAALDPTFSQKLIQNSQKMGKLLINNLRSIFISDDVKLVQGMGLLIGVEFHNDKVVGKLSQKMIQNGLLSKPLHKNVIRFSPPLIINQKQIEQACDIISKSWNYIKSN